MISEIAGSISAVKGAMDIVKGLIAQNANEAVTTKAVELNAVILDIQQQLLCVQDKHFDMQQKIQQLETENAQYKNVEQDKQRYQLCELVPQTYVYRLKEAMRGDDVIHDLCTNCFRNGIQSILQSSGQQNGHYTFSCPICKTVFLGAPLEMVDGYSM